MYLGDPRAWDFNEKARFARGALPGPLEAKPEASTKLPSAERELEILRLVAQGMTDPQVASRLYLSPRTVGQHLRSIYGKLGVPSRAAAAKAAVERSLI